METSHPRVENLRGGSLENAAGNSAACKPPRFVPVLKKRKKRKKRSVQRLPWCLGDDKRAPAAALPNAARNSVFQPIFCRPLGAGGTPGKREVVP